MEFKDQVLLKEKKERIEEDLFTFLKRESAKYSSPDIEGFGDFNGGFTGYISYEAVNYTGILRRKIKSGNHRPVAELLLIDDFIVYDNMLRKFYASTAVYTDRGELNPEIERAVQRLNEIEEFIVKLIRNAKISFLPSRPCDVKMEYSDSDSSFLKKVGFVKDEICSGEIIQGVISRRMSVQNRISPFSFYLKLRDVNPSPYMYFLKFGERFITGCSPETHLRMKGNRMLLKPIAGTAPIPEKRNDRKIGRKNLLRDQKERAEHLMLVDLARNDLSRIAAKGSVSVSEFMKVEDFSHVMHIVSSVKGTMREGFSAVDAFRETFPAGTVSGAPKVRAIEIIDDLEEHERWAYAGAVGYFSFSDNMDMAIAIRTMVVKNGTVYVQSGCGIVYDSVPEREYEETLNKAMAQLKAIDRAEQRKLTRSEDYALID
jgi:anthranilate synthase component 1